MGAVGYVNGWVTLGQITAAVLYVQALVEPLQRLIRMLDRLQVGIASTSRLLGIAVGAAGPGGRRGAAGRRPAGRPRTCGSRTGAGS